MIITMMLPIRPINASLLFLVHPFFTDTIPIFPSTIQLKLNLGSKTTLSIGVLFMKTLLLFY